MSVFEYLAREFKFLASAEGTTWTEVGGINSWKWKEDSNEVDITDFDDAGWDASMVARRKAGLSIEGNWLMDVEDGTRDAGQALVESFAREVGVAGLFYFKVVTRAEIAGTPPVPLGLISFRCSVKLGEVGGSNDDKMPWSAELMVAGAPTFDGCFA